MPEVPMNISMLAALALGAASLEDFSSSKQCSKVHCRPEGVIKLRLAKDKTIDEPHGREPAVLRDVVTLVPGEEIFVEATVEGDKLVRLQWVAKPKDPARTITLKLEQAKDAADILLTITHPFKRALKYRAGLMAVGSKRVTNTSSCAVQPGRRGSEHWPFAFSKIFLSDFHFVEIAKDAMACD